jgi:hypothetical protein
VAIARFAYCKVHNRDSDDPTLMPSDWLRWLEKQSWYQPHVPQANLYRLAVEHLLHKHSIRVSLSCCSPHRRAGPPSPVTPIAS